MKSPNEGVLSIDTSNYTTSVAVVDRDGGICADQRIQLQVERGERGLRQSHALFQHMTHLPKMMESIFQGIDPSCIKGVAVSDRPRSMDGSYMPVFLAGASHGRTLAAGLGVPLFTFSHQDGHLKAAMIGSDLSFATKAVGFHFSGGTCDVLGLGVGPTVHIGESKDLSFGQVIDRIGVLMGLSFPAGQEMDRLALSKTEESRSLKEIPFDGLSINLSGLETQARRLWETGTVTKKEMANQMFSIIARGMIQWSERAIEKWGSTKILYTGGVMESQFLRQCLKDHFKALSVALFFAPPSLSSDNAVGIGFMGGELLWQ